MYSLSDSTAGLIFSFPLPDLVILVVNVIYLFNANLSYCLGRKSIVCKMLNTVHLTPYLKGEKHFLKKNGKTTLGRTGRDIMKISW